MTLISRLLADARQRVPLRALSHHLGVTTRLRRRAAFGLLLAAWVGAALAQSSGGSYTLRKQAVVAGGRTAAPIWAMNQSLAEPGAGIQSGGSYRLTGGLQTPRLAGPEGLFANGFE